MNLFEVRKILNVDNITLDTVVGWMYEWWSKEEDYTIDEVRCYMTHSFQSDRLPQTFGVFKEDKIVGMYQISYDDLSIRPDIYPWICNVYVDEKFRGNGICKLMMETVHDNAKALGIKELYIFTKHCGLYEKYGWTFIDNIDTYSKEPRIQRLYKLNID